ncbi:hypothetical protein KP509_29G077300 [Ceratopteris richardii]|uniref:Ubiquitin-like domain-containing protein n=1 Tax=Ceratopteris richardii TaxID=49495 RepID=A0A8T2R9M5_CERRI|nr:hypothetical protein KP509_29G077300 [Ceratopteris richardii]
MATFLRPMLCGNFKYQRLDYARVSSIICDEDETSALQGEADDAPLLAKAMANYRKINGHYLVGATLGLKHSTFAFKRKHKARKFVAIIEIGVRKMDNTSFKLAVPRDATVRELKHILQNNFDAHGSSISWMHVWRNFCLSFNNQKLLDDRKTLHHLGIGNHCELKFTRHITSSAERLCQRPGFFLKMRKYRGLFLRNR